MSDEPDLQIVATYPTRFEAELAVAHLSAEGIEGMIRAYGGGAGAPTLGFTDGIPVLVPASDLEAAAKILEDQAF